MIFSLLKRRGKAVKMRVALGGAVLACAALYALAVAYDISLREMSVYLVGSVGLLVGTAIGAIAVVIVFKLLRRLFLLLFGPLIQRMVSVDDPGDD